MSTADPASTTGSARGWYVVPNRVEGIEAGMAFAWSAYCEGDSENGVAMTREGAAAMAQRALTRLIDDRRRRDLHSA